MEGKVIKVLLDIFLVQWKCVMGFLNAPCFFCLFFLDHIDLSPCLPLSEMYSLHNSQV